MNPTDETLNLIPFLSNTNNYSLDINMSQSIELRAQSSVKLPLNFSPSTLGTTDHQCKVAFICEQVRATNIIFVHPFLPFSSLPPFLYPSLTSLLLEDILTT